MRNLAPAATTPRPTTSISGFSLIEVVAALTILAITLTALFAILASSLTSQKQSTGDTRISSVAQQVFHTVQNELATDDGFKNPIDTSAGSTAPSEMQWTSPSSGTFIRVYYFNDQGLSLSDGTNAYFRVTVTLGQLDPSNIPPNMAMTMPASNDISAILKSLKVQVVWPAVAGNLSAANIRSYSILLRNRGSFGAFRPPYPP